MGARRSGLAIAGALLIVACGQESAPPTAEEEPAPAAEPAAPASAPEAAATAASTTSGLPARIVAERGGFIPEGIEFDRANRRILTGSLAEGTIFEIGADGSVTPAVEDPELVSSVGIEVDEPRDRLLVSNSDRAAFGGQSPGQAKLGVYSLTTGERLAMVDLGSLAGGGDDASFFANDVAVAGDGTAYVTDTMMNVIYRVDNDYNGSVFYRFEPMEGVGLNGIVAHDDGYLIVVESSENGALYKVPLDNPTAASQVALDEPVTGADGIVWDAEGNLAVVSNSESSVALIASSDDWASAERVGVATFEGQATTGAAVDDSIYVVEPHFNDAEPPVILRADF